MSVISAIGTPAFMGNITVKQITTSEALEQVLKDLEAMTPEELRAEFDKHKDSSFAKAMRETSAFYKEMQDRSAFMAMVKHD